MHALENLEPVVQKKKMEKHTGTLSRETPDYTLYGITEDSTPRLDSTPPHEHTR